MVRVCQPIAAGTGTILRAETNISGSHPSSIRLRSRDPEAVPPTGRTSCEGVQKRREPPYVGTPPGEETLAIYHAGAN